MFPEDEWDFLTRLFKFNFNCTVKDGGKASGKMYC